MSLQSPDSQERERLMASLPSFVHCVSLVGSIRIVAGGCVADDARAFSWDSASGFDGSSVRLIGCLRAAAKRSAAVARVQRCAESADLAREVKPPTRPHR
jgi:hypothetical protein